MSKTETLIEDINRKFKKKVLFRASDKRFTITRIPTGILTLDRILGGGIAKGRYTELFGPYSALKTYTSLRTVASAQSLGLKTLYCDAERSFDPGWATHCGVDVDALRIYTPDFGEELIDVVETVLRSREYGLIVVDSVAALIPQSEVNESATKEQMGLQGRLNSKMMRRLTAALSTDTAVILINQLREKIGVMWGSPTTTTGGRAIPFYAGQRVEFRPGEKIKNKENKVIGRVVSITIEKDKTGPGLGRVGEVTFMIGEGVDHGEELLTLGEAEGFVRRSGNTYSFRKWSATGRGNFRLLIGRKPKLARRLTKVLLNGHTPEAEVVGEEGET